MRLDLVERLRCPQDHAPTPLVVVARVKQGNDLREGLAGCMLCRLEARIRDGDLHFASALPGTAGGDGALSAPTLARSIATADPAAPPPDMERVIALLGLAEPGGAVLLTGRYSQLADALKACVEVAVVAMGATPAPTSRELVASVVGLRERVPFTDGTFRAAALDADASSAFVRDAVRAVTVGGRVLAAASLPAPPSLRELARDAIEWVAQREADVAPVTLRRG